MKKLLTLIIILSTSVSLSADKKKTSSSLLNNDSGNTIIGRQIPWLELDAFHKGKISKINMSDYRGRWIILFFYPADFTFVCPTELHELSGYYQEFRNTGAEVFSISTDSAYVHRAWQKENPLLKDITFPMLSDRAGNLSRKLGVYNETTGTAIRAVFIVDPDGRIVAAEFTHDSIGRNAGEILRKLDAAIAVRNGGGLCPAGWTEGGKMINEE